ncbi:MAG: TrkA family potassium uptake protein [Chthoniobacterales bacterium]|nr:TrkA family potassium uptake protein [Chthoniobacterales bacterium]
MKYTVVGLGEFGTSTALGLAHRGAEVIAVDIDMDRVNAVKDSVALAICLDASHANALRTHGIGDVDVLIAGISGNFEAQVLLVVHARQMGIPRIVARATSPDHIKVLKAVGATDVFNPEEEAARWIVQRLLIRDMTGYFELAEGFSIVEITVPPSLVGKTIGELDLRRKFRINLIAIKSVTTDPDGSQVVKSFNAVPIPDQKLKSGEIISFVGSVLDIANFMAHIE